MDLSRLTQINDYTWRLDPYGAMHVPVIIFADRLLAEAMDEKVIEQATNVAMLPGIVSASYVMPDGHWGYGFPIGGVAAFDAERGGVVSAGGVGFDISCGVRCLMTNLTRQDIEQYKMELAHELSRSIPAGVGSSGRISLEPKQMDDMLAGGAAWAVKNGYGIDEDLDHIEEHGKMQGAKPEYVSSHAKKRQKDEMGTLGSGNHYLEVQEVADIYDEKAATLLGLRKGQIVISIHCGSRGLGHQIGTEFLKEMVIAAPHHGINLPDRELACAPIQSELGQRYLGAMRAGINCALANRQIITHLLRKVFHDFYPREPLKLLYDVSHNTCKVEEHLVKGQKRTLYIHRKGATRAFGPGHLGLKEPFKTTGQPVMIGGTMGTTSYILLGVSCSEELSFSSSCHGAGRAMSRHQATKQYSGRQLVDELADRGIIIKSPTMRGVAEEAPHAYKDVTAVVECAHQAGLSKKIAKLKPIICVKG